MWRAYIGCAIITLSELTRVLTERLLQEQHLLPLLLSTRLLPHPQAPFAAETRMFHLSSRTQGEEVCVGCSGVVARLADGGGSTSMH